MDSITFILEESISYCFDILYTIEGPENPLGERQIHSLSVFWPLTMFFFSSFPKQNLPVNCKLENK